MRGLLTGFFLLLNCIINNAEAQEKPTPEDELKYQRYTKTISDSASKSYGLLEHAKKGKWEGYNIDSLQVVSETLLKNSRTRKLDFFRQHPDSYAALYHFNQEFLNSALYKVDSLETIFTAFSPQVKSTPLGQSVAMALKKKKTLLIGNEMPTFSFRTSEGNELDLTSFRTKKYVLLCFWDSWCAPCIRSLPVLKEINVQYGDSDLQLIHVSLDRTEKKWKESLNRYPMKWLQTLDLPPYINDTKVDDLFDIAFIPQYFLIDKQGKLIYHNVQVDDDEDYKKLKEMLKKITM